MKQHTQVKMSYLPYRNTINLYFIELVKYPSYVLMNPEYIIF